MITRLERIASIAQARRQTVAVAIYAGITFAAYAIAYLLRFEFSVPEQYVSLFLITVAPLVLLRHLTLRMFRLTRERWRYAGTRDVIRLSAAIILGSAVFLALSFVAPTPTRIPLSIVGLEGILTCWLTVGVWLAYRISFEHLRYIAAKAPAHRALIVGAGESGNRLAREMFRTPTLYRPVGFVDDNPLMWGARLQGIEVMGSPKDMKAICEYLRVDEIIIAVPSATPEALRRLVAFCEESERPFKVLPPIAAVIAGDVHLNQLRDVEIEDLLGRDPIKLELPELAADLHGRCVLITGAAGSIGSELSRQVALHNPERLVLLDQAETEMFYLELDLRAKHPHLEIVPVIGDVADAPSMERVFRKYMPSRVFHAAAYKHVPMMEMNAREAIRNNVVGTWRVAEAAGRFGAEKFVLVSTDKAVRPSNVMGATKRLAELIVLDLQQRFPATAYGAVRFGNVLGSNGSVIPVFKRQIREGKPLTVTHPDTTRYFMTIPEAVQLILQASMLTDFPGHIAMLEMGEPVRITDLAHNLIRLSGAKGPAARIVFTGLRPGEKLHEELSAPDEEAQPTSLAKVCILRTPPLPALAVASQVEAWAAALRDESDDALLFGFYDLFPGLTRDIAQFPPLPAVRTERRRKALKQA